MGAPVDATRKDLATEAARIPEAWEQVNDLMNALPMHRKWLAERIPKVFQQFSS